MLRNYLMPGFALVLLAIFAVPRSGPPAGQSAGESARSGELKRSETPSSGKPGTVPQIGSSKQIVDPDEVCSEAKFELREKLNEFGLDFPEAVESEEAKVAETTAGQPGKPASVPPSVESMIALVPDPVHTHLALRFDRYVDVIQQALLDNTSEHAPGWLYISQWLPWDPIPYQTAQDPVDRTNLHFFGIDRECAPGVLIFRRNVYQSAKVPARFLVVFLVGESPTSGILHEKQFDYAVQSWRFFQQRSVKRQNKLDNQNQKGAEDPDQVLRILGPSFSGSLPTLDKLLGEAGICPQDATGCTHAQVISGSVMTSRDVIANSENFPYLKAANFISVMESEQAIQKMLLNYFCLRERLFASQVAFVSEDETAFGNLLSTGSTKGSGSPEGINPSSPLLFHYPREISQLRNAYEKNSIFSRQSGQQSNTQNQQDLTLHLEDRHEAEDSVPSFSEAQSPISEESVLSAMTRAMDHADVRVAVVNGSDVLDVIFVARYFSRNLPNVRVVLVNSDLLFERAPDVSDFRGMMIANTYPLIPDNAWWTGRFLRMSGDKSSREESTEESQQHPGAFGNFLPQRVFTSFDSLGTYNATRILQCVPLTFSDAGEHTATPNCKARMIPASDQEAPNADGESDAAGNSTLWLAAYSDPFRGGGHPPFWLNAIGRGGFWPVDLLDRYLADTGSERTSSLMDIAAGNSSRHHDSIPTGMFDKWSRKPLSARLAAACLLALFVLFGLILCTFARLERWPQYFFGIKGTNSERRAWIVLVNILAFSWIARLLILDLPAGRFFEDPINWGLLALGAVLLLFASWVIGRALNDGQRPFWAWSIVFLTAASQVAFACIKPGERVAEIFYLYRSEYLFNGVSPVVPFIFLCIAVICLVSRHIYSLLIFSPLLKPRMPCYAGEGSPEILRSVSRSAVQDILQACYSPWRMLASKIFPRRRRASRPEKKSANAPAPKVSRLTAWLLLPTLLLFLIGARILFPQGLQTFETEAYGTLLTLCSVALMIFLLCEITWVALMWFCLQRGLLNPLERTTLRVCFSRVSGFSWRHLWFSFDLSPAVRFRPLFRAYESVLRIEKLRAVEIESDGRKEDESEADNAGEKNSEEREGLDQSIGLVTEQYTELMKNLEPNSRVRAFSKFEVALCRCATQVIRHILSGEERCKGSLGTSLDVTAKEIDQVLKDSQKDDPLGANAEELVGLIYIYAIQHVLMDIRSHILAFTFGYFFLLLALTVYPVGPHHSIMVLLILFFAALAIVVVTIFSQMHRDAILSRTTSTEPGKLDAGFYQKLISVLGVPLIGLLASQFPEISNFLFSWLEPSLQTLK